MFESKIIVVYKCFINILVYGLFNFFLYLDILYGYIWIVMNFLKVSILIVVIFIVVLIIYFVIINGF